MWIFYIALTLVIFFLLILIFSKLMLNMLFGKRCEGNPNLKYFTVDDFDKLNSKKIYFKSNENQIINGNIYFNKDIKENNIKGLIVFVHGMGGGHLSYTTEINTLVQNGYKVLAYDNTGTCSSEGKSLNGFYQSVLDLKACLEFIKTNQELNKYNIALVGHSWGGYTVCQILKYDLNINIKSVISISGCNSSEELICNMMGVFGKILKPCLRFFNKIKFGKDGIVSTKEILKNIDDDISILLLHGESDKTCPLSASLISDVNTDYKDKENIQTILYENRYHNIYQTMESEKYLNDIFERIENYKKKYKGKELEEKLKEIYDNIDYKKITEEDEDVMETIIEFLDNTI